MLEAICRASAAASLEPFYSAGTTLFNASNVSAGLELKPSFACGACSIVRFTRHSKSSLQYRVVVGSRETFTMFKSAATRSQEGKADEERGSESDQQTRAEAGV